MTRKIEEQSGIIETLEKGDELNISENVLLSIVSLVAKDVDGIVGLVGGFSIPEIFGKKNNKKGVKTIISGKKIIIDISLIVDYGSSIPTLAKKVRQEVKKSVEVMTGYRVLQVNVYIDGIKG